MTEEQTDEELKELRGKKVRVEGLDWGDVIDFEGKLNRFSKKSIWVDERKLEREHCKVKGV